MNKSVLFAVLLAAGSSRRFGSTKQLQEIDGSPMVSRAARLCESICANRSVVVLGKDWTDVHNACEPLSGFLVVNPEFRTGIASSIRQGVAAVRAQADGLLLVLADQPKISLAHLQALATKWQAAPNTIVASAYADTVGPPIIFPKREFDALSELEGDAGAKSILLDSAERVQTIACDDAALDIDVPEDLQKF